MSSTPSESHSSLKDQFSIFFRIASGHLMASPRRTSLTVALTLVTTALLVFVYSIMNGSHTKLKRDSVEVYTGYLRIQGKGFQKSKSPFDWIQNADALIQRVRTEKPAVGFTPRLESFGLFSSRDQSQGAMLVGIDPATESTFSRIFDRLEGGSPISDMGTGEVLVGRDFARSLKVGVGDELAFVGASMDSSIAAELLTIKGIFRSGFVEIDRNMVVVPLQFLQNALMADNVISHLVVHPERTDEFEIQQTALEYQAILQDLNIEAIPWTEELSHLVQTLNFDRASGHFTFVILLIIVFFVLLVYAQLSILTRTREIGVMRALGTSPSQVFSILIFENILTGLLGCALGALCGAALAIYFQVNPMEFPSLEEAVRQYGLSDTSLPTLFELSTVLKGFGIVLTIHLFSAVHPILKVTYLRPVEALHSNA